MARRADPSQLDLFGDTNITVTPVVVASTSVQPSGLGGSVDLVAQVLVEVHDGRYGLLDSSGRAVEVDGDQHCRYTDADGLLDSLRVQGYLRESDTVSCRHGVIAKPVTLLKLTGAGEKLRRRWSHLRPVL
ncbi:hypothetical protein GCM10010174_34910 [Kutzneria viridogrisea]|uniref:Uncharacterized protein n=1 Tax=Kutzneria viridogrisea TaxID=47990 RepID=A0ABR6BLB5_9PSEU|nr:hypothetical protein [Kutzneria viridogrisea]